MRLIGVSAIIAFTVLLVSFCTPQKVNADVLARAQNEANGQIMLLDDKGSCPQIMDNDLAFEIVSVAPSGKFIEGCWTYKDELVVVRYHNGTWRRYDPNKFVVEEGRQTK